MNNPFDYIGRDRESKAKQEAEARRKAQDESRRRGETFERLISQYGEMVVSVLKLLQDVAYPDSKITKPYGDPNDDNSIKWSIGKSSGSSEGFRSLSFTFVFSSSVDVILKLDKDDKPIGFLCKRGSSESFSALSADSLEMALKKLHPVGS